MGYSDITPFSGSLRLDCSAPGTGQQPMAGGQIPGCLDLQEPRVPHVSIPSGSRANKAKQINVGFSRLRNAFEEAIQNFLRILKFQ